MRRTRNDKVRPEIVEQLLIAYKEPEDIIGENGLRKQLTKAVLERALAGGADGAPRFTRNMTRRGTTAGTRGTE
jgi:hypothetical protein